MSESRRARRAQHSAVPTALPATIGVEPGRPRLRATGAKPPLGHGGWPLPELSPRQQKPKRWWLHPAFIVSAALTLLAMAGMATWMIITAVTSSEVKVSDISLSLDGGAAHVDWNGPEAAYNLYAVGGDGTVTDLSQLILSSTEAWLPAASGTFEDDTCFVVRSAEHAETPVSLNAADLSSQGAQSVCVADAQ